MSIKEFSESLVKNENGTLICTNEDYKQIILDLYENGSSLDQVYNDVNDVVSVMLNYDDIEDNIYEIAESLVDVSYYDIFTWAANNYSLVNEVDTHGMECNASQLVQCAQQSYYENIAQTIYSYFEGV
jgi:hypothetical protein